MHDIPRHLLKHINAIVMVHVVDYQLKSFRCFCSALMLGPVPETIQQPFSLRETIGHAKADALLYLWLAQDDTGENARG